MSLVGEIRALLDPLVGGRVYADVPPDVPAYPLITFQQVGGQAFWYMEKSMPGHRHARIQINVWSKNRPEADSLGRQVEKTLCEANQITQPYGALTALYESALRIFGTRQDFGIWFPEP